MHSSGGVTGTMRMTNDAKGDFCLDGYPPYSDQAKAMLASGRLADTRDTPRFRRRVSADADRSTTRWWILWKRSVFACSFPQPEVAPIHERRGSATSPLNAG